MLEVSIVQTYILQLKLITMQLFSIAILFQLYKLTSFNWNWGNVLNIALSLGVSIVQTYILQLKQMSKRRPIKIESVSIVQTYILQLKRKNRI